MNTLRNVDEPTVRSFGKEWTRFDQSPLSDEESRKMFSEYFRIFPWQSLPADCRGADIGCGAGRWARFVAGRVGTLHLVDASEEALGVARKNLSTFSNVSFHCALADALPFDDSSLDFAYCLGVLHHVPDTPRALEACIRKLKPGAPFLLYLYYAFDNRPRSYRLLWKLTDPLRRSIARWPAGYKDAVCDAVAILVYWPLARASRLASRVGVDVSSFPLSMYRDRSLYSMRTDSRDRFGTPLEMRFSADEILRMMAGSGLTDVRLSDAPPYWCAVGVKA